MDRRPKVAIIGAGGYRFPFLLIRDLLSFPALQDIELALMDIELERANRTLKHTRQLIDTFNLGAEAYATDDRREALKGCDFVFCVFAVGGLEAQQQDVNIPLDYGVHQAIGDTLGPGGAFMGLRSIAVLRGLTAEMREVCPDALLLQYANPMAINCWATNSLGIKTIGLCHSVQHTSAMLAHELQVPYEEVVYDCAGVNHTAWFTTFRHGDRDLIPEIYDTMIARHLAPNAPGGLSNDDYEGKNEKVRAELMRLTGYFHTESSHHASEYWSWFRREKWIRDEYLGHYNLFAPDMRESESTSWDERNDAFLEDAVEAGLTPSEEYGAYIVDSIVSGKRRIVYGNVPNNGGLIDNLPSDALVEVACMVDELGVRPVRYGSLPASCAALNNVQINVQRLATKAGLTGDRRALETAVALDPLTGAVLTLPKIRAMVGEMLDAQAEWLPQFAGSAANPAVI